MHQVILIKVHRVDDHCRGSQLLGILLTTSAPSLNLLSSLLSTKLKPSTPLALCFGFHFPDPPPLPPATQPLSSSTDPPNRTKTSSIPLPRLSANAHSIVYGTNYWQGCLSGSAKRGPFRYPHPSCHLRMNSRRVLVPDQMIRHVAQPGGSRPFRRLDEKNGWRTSLLWKQLTLRYCTSRYSGMNPAQGFLY